MSSIPSLKTPKTQTAIILAAGQGTRMKSSRSKIIHQVAGLPIIVRVIQTALKAGVDDIILVLGHQAEAIKEVVLEFFPDTPIEFALQAEQLGTAHAVMCAEPHFKSSKESTASNLIWILSGDLPTLDLHTFKRMQNEGGDASLKVAGMRLQDPKAYGRFLTDPEGLYAIREARDCNEDELKIKDVNAGIYLVDSTLLFEGLRTVKTDNAQGEYYLTDLVEYARAQNQEAQAIIFEGKEAFALEGVNDRIDLAKAENRIQERLRREALLNGVTLIDPQRVILHENVQFEGDVVIEPDVMILGNSVIGKDVVIEQGCRIESSVIEHGAHLHAYSHLRLSHVGSDSHVGPFARLREKTRLDSKVKIGNFVETKKTHFHEGAKASHLSYLGDAEIGAKANIGAGTITCNYDGYFKHKTQIGAGAFIGSDTQLVAPVSIGEGAFVAAGSTITQDVDEHALVLSRSPQVQKSNWAQGYHETKRATKEALKKSN